MAPISTESVLSYVVGNQRPRRLIVGVVLGILGLASGVFLLGLDVGLGAFRGGWIVVAFGIALVAGILGAGLGTAVGSLWLFALWWFAFPPIVGYLTGDWTMGSSYYHHPRMLGFGYTTARAELIGGLEYGVRLGLPFAVVSGTIVYIVGSAIGRTFTRPFDT